VGVVVLLVVWLLVLHLDGALVAVLGGPVVSGCVPRHRQLFRERKRERCRAVPGAALRCASLRCWKSNTKKEEKTGKKDEKKRLQQKRQHGRRHQNRQSVSWW
jgi:hypothetical protein